MTYARRTRLRMTLVVVALLAVVAVFVVRLVDIQVVRADGLREDSVGKRSLSSTVYGHRGEIVDANGVVLADTVERYDITASPRDAHDIERVVDKQKVVITRDEIIAQLAAATGEKADDIRKALDADPDSNFAYVAKNMTLEVRDAVDALDIPWIYLQAHPGRTYPLGAVAGNLVGFIGTDGPLAGLELSENESCIDSVDGTATYERGQDGVRLPGSTVTTKPAKDGGTLKLTIDSDFQWYVQQTIAEQAQAVGAQWATGMVVRVSDGHIMAAADYPSVDPNNYGAVDNLSTGSRAFTAAYEPGSTFKAMTAAMLIDAGKITQTTGVSVPNVLRVDGGTIQDVFSHPTTNWTTTGVLVVSSNIGTSLLAQKLDSGVREDYMRAFGLGKRTAVGFGGESSGLLSASEDWDPITDNAVSFGQGVSATSAQTASIYQTLGNGGVKMPLTLVEGCEWADGSVTEQTISEGERVVSEKAADDTVEMLANVTMRNTVLKQQVAVDGYNIAAKTGTAQVAEGNRYGDDRIVSVAGLIPGDDPEYAVVVTIAYPTTIKTSAAAAPPFGKIMKQIIKTYRVTPSTETVSELPDTW